MIVRSLKHFYIHESEHFKAHELYDSGKFATAEELIFQPILDFAEALREHVGRPLKINAGVRTQAKQKWLRSQGYRAATYSPHVYRCALDFDTRTKEETTELVEACREVADNLNTTIRIGWKKYLRDGYTFIHVDTAPLIAEAAFCEEKIPQWVYNAWKIPMLEW